MDEAEPTAPLPPDERGAVARLLEASSRALYANIDMQDVRTLVRGVTASLDRGALAIRRGNRARVLDGVAHELDALVNRLTDPQALAADRRWRREEGARINQAINELRHEE